METMEIYSVSNSEARFYKGFLVDFVWSHIRTLIVGLLLMALTVYLHNNYNNEDEEGSIGFLQGNQGIKELHFFCAIKLFNSMQLGSSTSEVETSSFSPFHRGNELICAFCSFSSSFAARC